MKYIYEVENLVKTYDNMTVFANDKLTFKIYESEIFGLLGPNGSGKTSLIKQLIGLLKPDSGSILFDSIDVVKNPHEIKNYIGYMSQSTGALADLTVYEALYVTSNLYGFNKIQSKNKANEIISTFKMENIKNKIIKKLSGGQRRLVSFAITIIHNPRVVFFDEPTNDLDPEMRKIIWDKIIDLKENSNTTIILATHNLLEAEKVLDRVAIMENGKIIEIGSLVDLKSSLVKNNYILTIVYKNSIEDKLKLSKFKFYDNLIFTNNNSIVLSCSSYSEVSNIIQNYNFSLIGEIEDFKIEHSDLEKLYLNIMNKKEIEHEDQGTN